MTTTPEDPNITRLTIPVPIDSSWEAGARARQYSRRTFTLRVPNTLLRQYFRDRGIAIDVDWDDPGETDDKSIVEVLDQLAADVSREIDTDFSRVYEIVSARGVAAIMEEAVVWFEVGRFSG